MRIVGGKVIVCSPGRNFVTLKLETEDGITGLGPEQLADFLAGRPDAEHPASVARARLAGEHLVGEHAVGAGQPFRPPDGLLIYVSNTDIY